MWLSSKCLHAKTESDCQHDHMRSLCLNMKFFPPLKGLFVLIE